MPRLQSTSGGVTAADRHCAAGRRLQSSTRGGGVNGKIALEEHFNLPEFNDELPQYVNPEAMREISRRLLDLATARVAGMDAAGIDYSLLSLTAPAVPAGPDPPL